jgi:hypothetical protein
MKVLRPGLLSWRASARRPCTRARSPSRTRRLGRGLAAQAILDANANAGPDAIEFAIGASGLQTISPASPLPAITEPVTIDGYTQAGAQPNTDPNGDNAVLLIELDGANAGAGAKGLVLDGGGAVVRGLVVNRFGGAASRSTRTSTSSTATSSEQIRRERSQRPTAPGS